MKYLSAWTAAVLLGLVAAAPVEVQHGTTLGRRANEKHADDPAAFVPTGGDLTIGAGPGGVGVAGSSYGPNGQMSGSGSLTGAGLTGTLGGQTYAPPPPAAAPMPGMPGMPAYAPAPAYAPPPQQAPPPPAYAPGPAYPPGPAYAPAPAYAPPPAGGEMPGMMPGSTMAESNGGGGGAGLVGGAGGPCVGLCLDKKPE